MTKQLTRTPDDRWVAGICGGLAEYTGVDATLVRLLVAAGVILGAGSLLALYLIAWVLIPVGPALAPQSTSSH